VTQHNKDTTTTTSGFCLTYLLFCSLLQVKPVA